MVSCQEANFPRKRTPVTLTRRRISSLRCSVLRAGEKLVPGFDDVFVVLS
jgi:hypothetical protein